MALSANGKVGNAAGDANKRIVNVSYRVAEIKDGGFAKNRQTGRLVTWIKDADGANVKPTAAKPGAGNVWQQTYKTDLRRIVTYSDKSRVEETPHFSINVGVNNTGDDEANIATFVRKAEDMIAVGKAIIDYCAALSDDAPPAKSAAKAVALQDIESDEGDGEDVDI